MSITARPNMPVSNTPGVCGAVVNYTTPVAIDNCPGVTTVRTAGLASGSTFPIGTTVNTYTATDAAGHTATCTFSVTVNDTQAPAITCPANITVNTPVGSCTAVVNFAATATDKCPGTTIVIPPPPAVYLLWEPQPLPQPQQMQPVIHPPVHLLLQ